MNDRTVLGCWGALLAIPVALAVAWMALDALLYAGATLSTDGGAAWALLLGLAGVAAPWPVPSRSRPTDGHRRAGRPATR